MITIDELKARTDEAFAQMREDLTSLVAIPSVSSSSFDQSHVQASAEFTAELLAGVGMDSVEILKASAPDGTVSRPAVVARRDVNPDAPRVLLYAHHDVQPPGDVEDWDQEDPFTVVERDGRLYGRGTADDKAGVIAHIGALRVLGDDLGVNITCFIEGEEEIGSPTFAAFLEQYHEALESDVIVVLDSSNWKVGEPALTTSLRGVVDLSVELTCGTHAVHSGIFGGPYLDANLLMCRLLATLHDDAGDVVVEGLTHAPDSDLDYPEEQWRSDAGLIEGYELAGTGSLPTRLWSRPAFALIGMDITSVAMKSNTIAPSCRAALSLRIPPGQDPREAAEAVRAHLEKHAPNGARVEVDVNELGAPFDAGEDTPMMLLSRWAMTEAWGHEAVSVGLGASIPFISDLADAFPEADILITGIEDPDTRAHGANESLDLGEFKGATLAEALLLAALAGDITPDL
ncbi:MAG: dipeptidase [Bowdeniella nasicola]|nr:dipeptidase [Bowdeniella nasicola]